MVTELRLLVFCLSVSKVTFTQGYCSSAKVAGFKIIFEIAINFLDKKILKIKELRIDKTT